MYAIVVPAPSWSPNLYFEGRMALNTIDQFNGVVYESELGDGSSWELSCVSIISSSHSTSHLTLLLAAEYLIPPLVSSRARFQI
jgi:hypothetical protein